jgi:hypothetical protein
MVADWRIAGYRFEDGKEVFAGQAYVQATSEEAALEEARRRLKAVGNLVVLSRLEAAAVLLCPRCGEEVESVIYRRNVRTEYTYGINVRVGENGAIETETLPGDEEGYEELSEPDYEVLCCACHGDLTELLGESCVQQHAWTPLPEGAVAKG